MALHRTHILLDPEQHTALTQIARKEGRSISDITREIIQLGIEQRQKMEITEQKRRLEALENTRIIRKAILDDRGGKSFQVDIAAILNELREERDANIFKRSD